MFAKSIGAAALLFCVAAGIVATAARADTARSITIPAGELNSALESLVQQTGVQLLYDLKQVEGLRTDGVKGFHSPQAAVTALLKGTSLTTRTDESGAILIVASTAITDASTDADAAAMHLARARLSGPAGDSSGQDASRDAGSASAREAASSGIEEIIVTAQKRAERLQDVPIPVTAISGERLADANLLRLRDYFARIPGLNVTPGVQASQSLVIRGITTGSGNPTVGTLIDEAPYGASAGIAAGGNSVPDLDPSDLERVEVLRGPQGTLYGASSMGGLIKFVTRDPSTEGFSGRVQAGMSSVYNGDEPGYNLRGSVNVPLGETLAMRASAFTRLDPGYIDNPVLGIDGVNRTETKGGRLSALWRPSDAVSLKLSALVQEIEADGTSSVYLGAGLGDLQQNPLIGTGGFDRRHEAYSAVLTAALGRSTLTSVSGYNVNSVTDKQDSFTGRAQALSVFGVTGTYLVNTPKTTRFTQEVRLSMPLGSRADWLFGVYYTDEDSRNRQLLAAVNTADGSIAGTLLDSNIPTAFQEYAAFTDVTFHVTERFDVQVGGRESWIEQTFAQTQSGPFVPLVLGSPSPLVLPDQKTRPRAFTYLVTPQLKLAPELLVYARFASGYRAGGTNGISPGTPQQYDPDKTQNYEVGMKGGFFDRRLSLDASVYYIDWDNIQLLALNTQTRLSFFDNASRAKSQGVELSMEVKPLRGMTIAGWVAYNDAQLIEAFPANSVTFGAAGNRLPFSSRISGNLSVDQEFPVGAGWQGFVGGAVSYVDDRLGPFTGTPARASLPSYTQLDLSAGLRYESWTVNLFANNVADKRGVLVTGNPPAAPSPSGIVFIQPRTVGLSVAKTF